VLCRRVVFLLQNDFSRVFHQLGLSCHIQLPYHNFLLNLNGPVVEYTVILNRFSEITYFFLGYFASWWRAYHTGGLSSNPGHIFFGNKKKQWSCDGRGGAQRPFRMFITQTRRVRVTSYVVHVFMHLWGVAVNYFTAVNSSWRIITKLSVPFKHCNNPPPTLH
jgi:hypothetical protein